MRLIWQLLVCAATLTGCASMPDLTSVAETDNEPVPAADLRWLHYADPVADANLAAGNQQYHLLLIGDNDSIPGVLSSSTSKETIQQRCGFKMVTGDTSKIRDYVQTYNQQMLPNCMKFSPVSVANQE